MKHVYDKKFKITSSEEKTKLPDSIDGSNWATRIKWFIIVETIEEKQNLVQEALRSECVPENKK